MPKSTATNAFPATLTFYIQTWDEYYTQTLTLGIISGPVEGILTLCIVYAITAIKGGGSFWQQSMLQTFGVPENDFIPEYFYKLPFNEWYMVYGGIVLVFNTLQRHSSHSRHSPIRVYRLTWFPLASTTFSPSANPRRNPSRTPFAVWSPTS